MDVSVLRAVIVASASLAFFQAAPSIVINIVCYERA